MSKKVMNKTNQNIDWASYSWNPVTGCNTGCEYCYARDISIRFWKHCRYPRASPWHFNGVQASLARLRREASALLRDAFTHG
jgi:DNA repair photolyase